MLRVAVPNKGTLSEPASEILSEAGYRRRTDSKDLTVVDPATNAVPGNEHDADGKLVSQLLNQRKP